MLLMLDYVQNKQRSAYQVSYAETIKLTDNSTKGYAIKVLTCCSHDINLKSLEIFTKHF